MRPAHNAIGGIDDQVQQPQRALVEELPGARSVEGPEMGVGDVRELKSLLSALRNVESVFDAYRVTPS